VDQRQTDRIIVTSDHNPGPGLQLITS